MRNKYLIQNWVFIIGLILLTLNDHYFKSVYYNYTTGKLSDFSGLMILPLFLTYVFPRAANTAAMLSGIFFIFWKSPFSQPLIDVYNSFAFIPICRVADYEDLMALLVLPLSHIYILKINNYKLMYYQVVKAPPSVLVVLSSLVFMATSPAPRFYLKTQPIGDEVIINEYYRLNINQSQVFNYLLNTKFKVSYDNDISMQEYLSRKVTLYKIDDVKLNKGKDSLKIIRFRITNYVESTNTLVLNTIDYYQQIPVEERKKLTKYYRKLIEKEIIEPLRIYIENNKK
jgi:hypothetical protein